MRLFYLILILPLLVFHLHAVEKEKEQVSIILKWFYQYQFAGIIMAKEKGFYDEAGLDVTIVERDPGKNNIIQVIEGEAEYGIADSSILTYRAQGHPVKIIASIFQHNAMVMITRRESGIVSPYEMRGKRISYQEGIDDAIFGSMFAYADLHKDDFIKLPMDFSYQNIINGDADVIAAYITDQPYWIRKRGIELNIINPLSYGIDLYGDIIFTTEEEIKNHPERVMRFKKATLRGWEYALKHKEETVRTIIEKYKPSLEFDQLMYEARETHRLIAPERVALGYTSKDRFRIIAGFYDFLGLSEKSLNKAVDEIIYDPYNSSRDYRGYLITGSIIVAVMLLLTLLLYYHNRRLQAMVAMRTQELELSKQHAELAAQSKSQFLANMSHEIRTPMNAILGFVDQLAKNEHDPERHKQFTVIKKSGQTLLSIINDILDLSKIESGKMSVETHPCNITELFEVTVALFEELVKEKQLLLTMEISDEIPLCIMTDQVRIKQVVFNLLSNAVKFTPEHGRITLEVRCDKEQNRLHCAVSDTGVGIAAENLQKIFNAFDQEDISTTRKFGGTGLGLSISSRLIRMMGGELHVQSRLGEGSRFFFDIPAMTCPEEAVPAEMMHHDPSGTETGTLAGHLLVVEDNATNQMLMGIVLDDIGVTYDMAADGVEAVSMFKAHRYDAILMDENMPNMNGIDATRHIRNIEAESHLSPAPIIAVTANALSEDRKRFLDAGMDDYVSKPYTVEEIETVLRKYLIR